MNILFLSGWFPYPPENGSKIRIYNLIKALSKFHNVTLISFVREGEHIDPEGLNEICRLDTTIPWREFAPHSWKSILGTFSPTPRSVIDTYNPQMAKQLKLSIAKDRPDIIIASEVNTAIYVGRKWGIPCILDEIQLGLTYQLWSTSRSPINQIHKTLFLTKIRLYTRFLVNRFDACIVASEIERELFSQLLSESDCIHVIPNGVDLDFNRPGIAKPKPNTLIYNGALTFNANYDAMRFFLQDIFPSIQRQIPEVTLKISGSTMGVDISQLNMEDNVILSGFLPDIRPAVAESWACVVPLRFGGGTRLKILEAMALGTPVVATSKAAEGLAVSPEKNILLAETPEQFSIQTVRLLRDCKLREELARNGRELVEKKYSWEVIGSSFNDLVDGVINRRKV
jgi:glycosyltransferase involved in cell wall biosynthesis